MIALPKLASLAALAVATNAAALNYTVTNLNDSGAGSLRDAVALANANPGADTIDFAVNGTITLTSGLIRIESGPLTITGPGSALLTLDGNLTNRIFSVIDSPTQPACPALSGPSDYPVTITGVTMRNARRVVVDSGGGAIYTAKTLTLQDVVIRDSAARVGGGVNYQAQYPGQTLTIANSTFYNNRAMPVIAGNSGSYVGGALRVGDYCAGTRLATAVTITDSVFDGNRAQPDTLDGVGGAIAIFDNATVTMTRVRVINNGVDRPTPPVPGFTYPGGGLFLKTTNVTIRDSEIANNVAMYAGGIEVSNDVGSLQTPGDQFQFALVNSTVSGNLAYVNHGGVLLWGNVGAGIANSTIALNQGLSGISGLGMDRPGGAFLAPELDIVSSILGQQPSGADLGTVVASLPATSVNIDNSLVQTLCATCNITLVGSGNLIGHAPVLGTLAFSGGPTRTMPLLAGSPAINTGSNPLALPFDQRGPGFPRAIGGATDMGAMEGVGACSGFTDVLSDSTFCPNVDYLKNRNITLGCTSSTAYCPADPVTRVSMAAFMNRLGKSLSPASFQAAADGGAHSLLSSGNTMFCPTANIPPENYRRNALVTARVAALADGNFMSWRGSMFYSVDGGNTWQTLGTSQGIRVSSAPGQWTNVAPNSVFVMQAGRTYRFAIGINRDNLVPSTGNFVQSHCEINAKVVDRRASVAPFDE
jgi:hypothetical protein